MFIDNFELICAAKGISPSAALLAAGIPRSRMTDYRKDHTKMPRQEKLYELATVLGCEVTDFFTEKYASAEDYVAAMHQRAKEDYQRAMDSFGLTDEEEEFLRIFRSLGPKQRHQLMAKVYEFDQE